jgi:hypothetical protein
MNNYSQYKSPRLMSRNPKTHLAHKRQVFYQITLPLVISGVLVLFLGILATQATASKASTWADISLIMMILPTMISTILFLFLTAGSIFLMVKLLPLIPPYAYFIQEWFAYLASRARVYTDKSVEPIMRVNSFIASTRAFKRNLRINNY